MFLLRFLTDGPNLPQANKPKNPNLNVKESQGGIPDLGLTFKLTIFKPEEGEELIPTTTNVNKARIDIEKYDRSDPTMYIAEVEQMVADGRDFKNRQTIGTTAGWMISECFFYWIDNIEEKQVKGKKPNFWDIRLAMTSVMMLRCGAELFSVKVANGVVVEGMVVDASTDGSQVRLLFELPAKGYDQYKNQRYLSRHTSQWFELYTGSCMEPHTPFTLADHHEEPRPFTKPGLK